MVNLAVDQQYVTNWANNIALLNSNLYANYQNAFQNWLLASSSEPSGQSLPAPTAPQLAVANTALALQLVVAFDNAWAGIVGVPGAKAPTLDLSPAITYVQAAAITPPVQVEPPPPNDPVGPPQGVVASDGKQMYYTVAGDTSPGETVITDTRGTFTKITIQTPFGGESYWEKS